MHIVQIGKTQITGCSFSQAEHVAANQLRQICEAHGLAMPKPLTRDIIKGWGRDIDTAVKLGKAAKL